jgi:3-keto-5-aminohexanoate cleavage enzyme
VGMINYAKYLEKKELIRPPYYFNLICGNIACAQADLLHIGLMLRDLPPDSLWSLGGVGGSQVTVNSIAIVMGGGVRVGLEDNIWYDTQRERLASNSDLIHRIHRFAKDCGREVMTPLELRALLKLEKEPGQYGRVSTGAITTGALKS